MNRYRPAARATADLDGIWLVCAQDSGIETANRLIKSISHPHRRRKLL